MHIWKHFYTITHHKLMVMRGCFAVGLYWQGLMHDLSKYM
ncbi:MAG: catalase, partial [Lachnospiraceae bacterium]|nr:catalase [Lachnospiraceae bacterium]